MAGRYMLWCLISPAVIMLAACQRPLLRDGVLADGFPLQDSSRYTAPAACLQNVKLQSDNKVKYYQLVYDATSDVHQLLILSTIGQRLVTVTHSGMQVDIHKSLPISMDVSPKELLRVMQLVYWPVSALNEGTRRTGWRVEQAATSRQIYRERKPVAKIEYREFYECQGVVDYRSDSGEILHIQSISF